MKFVPVAYIKLDDPLWTKQFVHVRDVVLPYMWGILNDHIEIAEKSHCIENFKVAAGLSNGDHYGTVFIDTDLHKWIEAVSYEKGGLYVKLARKGDEYTLTIDGGPIDVFLRLPENSALSGDQFELPEDGYFSVHHAGGRQEYSYSLKPLIRVLRAHPSVSALAGMLCVQRGLTIYCAEGVDNAEPLSTLRLPVDAVFTEEKAEWLEEDMPILKTDGYSVSGVNWERQLYGSQPCVYESHEITLIPYSHWGNRGEHEMRV